jgi:hypothetical protein
VSQDNWPPGPPPNAPQPWRADGDPYGYDQQPDPGANYGQPGYAQQYGDPSQYGQPYPAPPYQQPQYQGPPPQYSNPAYPGQQYAQPAPQYAGPQYGEPQYAGPQYAEPQYAEPAYSEAAYGQPGYGEPPYNGPAYGQPQYEQQYGQAEHGQAQYGQAQYGQAQYGQAQYGPAQYGQAPSADAGYPAYPPPGRPQPTGSAYRGGSAQGGVAPRPARVRSGEPDYDESDGEDYDDDDPGLSRRTLLIRLGISGAVLVVIIAALLFVPGSPLAGNMASQVRPSTPPVGGSAGASSAAALTPLPLHSAAVTVPSDVSFLGWAFIDQRTGEITGNENYDKVNTMASMIKAWIAADFLRTQSEAGSAPSTSRLHEVSIMIRDSDNAAATDLYAVNGASQSIARLIDICGLTETKAGSRWSLTELSARDAARMGLCIANGKAAGPKWTNWLLNEMRNVRGEGDYGIRKAFPADQQKKIAIKNGWFPRPGTAGSWPEDGNWHMNCLAIGDIWVLAVEMRFPNTNTFDHGKAICQSVAEQLLKAA